MKNLVVLVSVFFFLFLSCSNNNDNPADSNNDSTDWKYGESKSYDVSSSTSIIIDDELTGFTFTFPDGGSGKLEIKEIEDGPSLDYEAVQFNLEYSGNEMIEIEINKDGAEDEIAFFGYYSLGNTVLDQSNEYENWWGIPAKEETSLGTKFSLRQSGTLLKANISVSDPNKYAVSKLKSGSNVWQTTRAIRTTVQQCIDFWLNNMSPSQRTAAEKQINGDLRYSIAWSNEGNSYVHGNNWIASNSVFYFLKNEGLASIAHEVGHYMHHVLCGYEEYNNMVKRFPTDFLGRPIAHAPGDYREGRVEILEDIAGFSEYIITNDYNFQYDPQNLNKNFSIYQMFNSKEPDAEDYPSHEGFAVWVLAGLLRKENKIYSYRINAPMSNVPVVKVPLSEVFEIIKSGPDNINQLRETIEAYLFSKDPQYQNILSAMFEPIGWSYNGFGFVLDENNQPIKDATVISVCKAGGEDYYTRESTPAGDNGRFYLDRIFPGTNKLRVYYNNRSDSTDFPFTADWNEKTNTSLDLGELRVTSENVLPTAQVTQYVSGGISGYMDYELEVRNSGVRNYLNGSSETWDTTYTITDESWYSAEEFNVSNVFEGDIVPVLSWSGASFYAHYSKLVEVSPNWEWQSDEWEVSGNISSDGKKLNWIRYALTAKNWTETDATHDEYRLDERIIQQVLELQDIPISSYSELNHGYANVYYELDDYNTNKNKVSISYVVTENHIEKNKDGLITHSYSDVESLKKFIITSSNSSIYVGFDKYP
jgi:hypothetical protein